MSEWKGESILTFLELSCNRQQVCLVGAGQFLFYSPSARLASREWPHGDSANFHGSWAIFSPSLAAQKCCKETATYNSCLHPALVFLSWLEGPGCVGSRGSSLERIVVGTGRRSITWEGAMGRAAPAVSLKPFEKREYRGIEGAWTGVKDGYEQSQED